MQNPDPSVAANVTITYLIQTNPTSTRTAQHTLLAATRQTIDVDKDLHQHNRSAYGRFGHCQGDQWPCYHR